MLGAECDSQRALDAMYRARMAQREERAAAERSVLVQLTEARDSANRVMCFDAWRRWTNEQQAQVKWGKAFLARRAREAALRLGKKSIFREWRIAARAVAAENITEAGEAAKVSSLAAIAKYDVIEVSFILFQRADIKSAHNVTRSPYHILFACTRILEVAIGDADARRAALEEEVAKLRELVSVAERKIVATPVDRLRRFIVVANSTTRDLGRGIALAARATDGEIHARAQDPALERDVEFDELEAVEASAAVGEAEPAVGAVTSVAGDDAGEGGAGEQGAAVPPAAPGVDLEADIVAWRPGQTRGKEIIPANKPFETRAGRSLIRWLETRVARLAAPGSGAAPAMPHYSASGGGSTFNVTDGRAVAALLRERLERPDLTDSLIATGVWLAPTGR